MQHRRWKDGAWSKERTNLLELTEKVSNVPSWDPKPSAFVSVIGDGKLAACARCRGTDWVAPVIMNLSYQDLGIVQTGNDGDDGAEDVE